MDKSSAVIKVDTEENWKKAINYIPDKFTIIVYKQLDESAPKIKIGDGIHTVNALPFLMQKSVQGTTLIL